MKSLKATREMVLIGIAILISVGFAEGQDGPLTSVRDYWPTDGWRECAPEQQGMNSQILAKIKPYIDQELPQVRSVLIVRNGYLVYEQYFQYFNRDYKQGVASVTKSISSALVGIALKEGYLKSLDQKLIDIFPEYVTPDIDSRVQKINLKHLLTMSSGFDIEGLNWRTVKEKINQKPIHEPGEIFAYSSDTVDLLSPILVKTTGLSMLDFAKKYLFEPLGISEISWEKHYIAQFERDKYHHAAKGISLNSRDMAKFGYFYLNNGTWNGKQIVPSNFIKESTQKQIKGDEFLGSEYLDYGYLWWVSRIEKYPVYTAWGYGGQLIIVLSDLDMVIVITSSGDDIDCEFKIIGQFIIPAILK